MTSRGLLLSDDLIFTSRVTGTARDLGLSVMAARSADVLLGLAAQQPPACVIVDLQNPGLELRNLLDSLRGICRPMPRVVAYGSHVDAESLRAARLAGCEPVLPRSQFVEQLAAELPNWFSGS
jgi:CheY-like chemotaxis protein